MSNLDLIARAIAIQEGFLNASGALGAAHSRPVRDNNPGDLEASSFATSKDGPYSVFPTAYAGWQGLYRQLGLYRDRGLTLAQVVAIYAPPNENNTAAYLAAVAARTGLDPNTRLADVIPKFDTNNPPVPAGLPGVAGGSEPLTFAALPALPSFDSAALVDGVSSFMQNGPVAELALGVLVAGVAYFLLVRS